MIGASRIAGYLDPAAARSLFGDPRSLVVTATGAVGRAVPVDGGYRVSGRWPFGSGIHGATAVSGVCAVELEALVAAVGRGGKDLMGVRAGLRQAAAHAAETALRVAAMLEGMAGTAAILEAGPLARRLRDLRACVQHVAMAPSNFIVAGRLAMGLDAGTTRV